jgi:TolB-like protein/Tfp pilus assembly protein PilF
MASIIPGYNYDIFVSYRQKDNKYDGWVTEFVDNLKKELEATFKEDLSVYFDINPHDGLLETHDVDASLKEKLKCLVFIPVISQTYCDPKAFAWGHEFCAFNELAKEDQLGRDIRLGSGNVASRILPVRIHELDKEDKILLENELGTVLRSIEFIFKSAGVNRPLRANEDNPQDNLNKTFYRDQINKVANAVKEIITAIKRSGQDDGTVSVNTELPKLRKLKKLKPQFVMIAALVLILIVAGYFFIPKLFKYSLTDEKSVAVLPFENLSSNEQEWFSDGISDIIINQLSKISGLRVIGRTSTLKYKDDKKTIQEIGKELGVSYVIEGTVQKQEDKIRVSVQMVRVRNEDHVWSEFYDKEWKDIFNIQTDIAENIANNLETILTPEERNQIEHIGTDNPEAYRLFKIGDFLMTRLNESDFYKAIDNYQQAIALDPDFAQAYARMASAYFELTMWDVPEPDITLIPRARDYALQSLKIDNNLGEPYFILAAIKYIHEFDFSGADQDFKKGMELSPDYVWGRLNYANYLTMMNRISESVSISRQTMKLNPQDPWPYLELGFALAQEGRYKEALENYNKHRELSHDPNNGNVMGCLHELYTREGTFNKFLSDQIDTLLGSPRKDIRIVSTDNLIGAGQIFADVGHRAEALKILDEINRRIAGGENVSHYDLGFLYNELGEKDKALDLFERGYNEEGFNDVYFNGSFKLDDPIRSDRRFKELLRKMGFEY